jgi:hypothetical protein
MTAQKKKRDPPVVKPAAKKKQPEMPLEVEEAVEVTLLWDSGTQLHTMDDNHHHNNDHTNFHYADDDTTTIDSADCLTSGVVPTTIKNHDGDHQQQKCTLNHESEMHQSFYSSSLLISSPVETLL